MNESISRRDFVNGTLVAGAGLVLHRRLPNGLPPEDEWTGYGGVGDYRRSNGNTREVMDAAHMMRDGIFERSVARATDTGEVYDLVCVGGGISGLAAAVFFQKSKGGHCLVLDNHPIFGGEAKRNEFVVDGQTVVAHQGDDGPRPKTEGDAIWSADARPTRPAGAQAVRAPILPAHERRGDRHHLPE